MLLDTLMVKITGDASGLGSATSKAKSDIGGLGDSAEGAGGKFSTFFQSVKSSAFGNIIADMAQTAISALSDLSSEAIEASDSTQKFTSTLNFAGVDASKIEELTASTQKYADETVYGLSDIRNITAQLASNGVPNYEKLAEAAGNLNAVAGGTADTYKSVGMVLTQTAGQGKLTTENWNQLSDAIPGASGKLQQALLEAGAYTGNFRDAMAAGEITADEFNDAILDLGLTDAAQEAATATTTWEGAFGNLEAACVNLMTQGLDLIKPAATAAINGLTDVISAIPNTVGAIGNALGVIQSDWDGVMSGLQQTASSVWNGIKGVISGAIQAVQGAISSVLGVIQGVWSGAWNAISSFLNGAWESIKSGVSSGIDGVLGFMRDLPGRILNALGNLGTLLLDAGKSIMKGLLDGITSGVQGVFDFVGGIGDTIASLKGPIPYDLKLLIPNGQAIMKSLLTGINNGVTGVFNRVSDIGGEIANSLSGDYTIPVVPELKIADFNGTLPSNGSKSIIDPRPVVNEAPVVNVKNIIVRSDEDFDSAATVFNRNIMHELNWSQYAQ